LSVLSTVIIAESCMRTGVTDEIVKVNIYVVICSADVGRESIGTEDSGSNRSDYFNSVRYPHTQAAAVKRSRAGVCSHTQTVNSF